MVDMATDHTDTQWKTLEPLLPEPKCRRDVLDCRIRLLPWVMTAHDALVPDSVLDELHQPFVDQGSKQAPNVCIEHPVHLPRSNPDRQGVERLV